LLYVLFTLRGIFAFSGTNLLTRCHRASSCFLLFLYFKKVIQEVFSELDETKAEVPILLTQRRSPKERQKRATSRPHQVVARPGPWPHHPMAWAPRAPTDLAILPINSLHQENPKAQASIHEKYCKPLPSSTLVREGPEALPSTLPERGIFTGGLLHRHAWVVHLWTMGP
jgi:hypothetical protein